MIKQKSPAYFLSDCHLPLISDDYNRDWDKKVIRFLQSIRDDARSLFLIGDIFDFWFEWKHAVPSRAFPVLSVLHEMVKDDISIFYLAGNHDHHPGRFLENEVGLYVSRTNLSVKIEDKRLFLVHGDGIAEQDKGYRMLRSLVRWGPTEHIFRQIHPDWGIGFAKNLSKGSRKHFSSKDKFGVKPYRDKAFTLIDQGYDYVLMGHRHDSGVYNHGSGSFFAIGNWIGQGTYCRFENGEMQMLSFK